MIKCNNIEAAEKLIQFLYDSRNQIQCSQIIDIQVDSMTSQVYIKNTVLNRIVQMYNKNQNEIYIYDYLAQNPQFFFNQTGTQISFSDETFKMFVDNYLNSKDVALLTSIGGNVQVCVDSKIISSEAIRLLERKTKPSRIAKQQYQTKICLEKLLNIIKSDFILASSKLSTIQQLDIIFNNMSLENNYNFYYVLEKQESIQQGIVTKEHFNTYIKVMYPQDIETIMYQYIDLCFQQLNLQIKHIQYKTQQKSNIQFNNLISGLYLKSSLSLSTIKQLQNKNLPKLNSDSNNLMKKLFNSNILHIKSVQVDTVIKSLIFVSGDYLDSQSLGIITEKELLVIKTNGPQFIRDLTDLQFYQYIFEITQTQFMTLQIKPDQTFKNIIPNYYVLDKLNRNQQLELDYLLNQNEKANQTYICQIFENTLTKFISMYYNKINVEFCLQEALYIIQYYQKFQFHNEKSLYSDLCLVQQQEMQDSILLHLKETKIVNTYNKLQQFIFNDMLTQYYIKNNISFVKSININDNFRISNCASNIFSKNLNTSCLSALQQLSAQYLQIATHDTLLNNKALYLKIYSNYLKDLNKSVLNISDQVKNIINTNLESQIYMRTNHNFSEEQILNIISQSSEEPIKNQRQNIFTNQSLVTFNQLQDQIQLDKIKYCSDYIINYSIKQTANKLGYKQQCTTIDNKTIYYLPQLFIIENLTIQAKFCIESNTNRCLFDGIKQYILTNYELLTLCINNHFDDLLMHILYYQQISITSNQLVKQGQSENESDNDTYYEHNSNYSENLMEQAGIVTYQQIQKQIMFSFSQKLTQTAIKNLILLIFPNVKIINNFKSDKYQHVITIDTIFYHLYNKNLKEKTKQVIQLLHDDTSDIIPEMVNEFEQIISEHYEFKEYDKDVDTFVIDQNYTTMDLIMLRFKQSFGKKFIIKHCCKALENKKLSMATCYKVLDGHSDMDYYIQDLVLNLYSKYDTQLSNKKRQLIRYYKSESWKFTIRLIHNEELEQIFKPFLSENYHILRHNKQQSVINDILIKSSKNKLDTRDLLKQLGLVTVYDIYDKLITTNQIYLQVSLRHQTIQKIFGFHCEQIYTIHYAKPPLVIPLPYQYHFVYLNLFDKSIVNQETADKIIKD
ncbi:Hypothetical_protein [Hexamita inflata]|uniref:Hypothetical_protein n=1 Tax=Hexamita inflata TaxID=28002 RepID=A0AA86ULP0_9EUKA|nr:Hypothetical protein HINF_LOCUS43832 [Hexamita inflata]